MPALNPQPVQSSYDPRWFIWTIVFLVVSGVSLVSYIVLSDSTANAATPLAISRMPVHKTTEK